MERVKKTFLLKNDNDSVFINFELKNYLSILKILSSSPQEISIIEEIIQQTNLENLPEWLNNFFEIFMK